MSGYSLKQLIESSEFMYLEVNTREYGDNSVRRGGWMFEDDPLDPVHDVLIADLIIKNENRTWARYIPRIEKAVKAILSHSRKVDLDPDDWPLMIEIAQRVKNGLPDIKIVPDGQD
ncbi:MAG: hypothetical protein K2K70_06845 [Lachnospiraceae bacterium]|nr:hypothetical protein [Lachnospiraceae bacterium]